MAIRKKSSEQDRHSNGNATRTCAKSFAHCRIIRCFGTRPLQVRKKHRYIVRVQFFDSAIGEIVSYISSIFISAFYWKAVFYFLPILLIGVALKFLVPRILRKYSWVIAFASSYLLFLGYYWFVVVDPVVRSAQGQMAWYVAEVICFPFSALVVAFMNSEFLFDEPERVLILYILIGVLEYASVGWLISKVENRLLKNKADIK